MVSLKLFKTFYCAPLSEEVYILTGNGKATEPDSYCEARECSDSVVSVTDAEQKQGFHTETC